MISKRALKQYILLYLAFILHGSYLEMMYLSSTLLLVMTLTLFIGTIIHPKYRNHEIAFFGIIFMALIVLCRFITGGVGIVEWVSWMLPILLVYYAIKVDEEHIAQRFVKFVVYFSTISLICFTISQFSPQILAILFPSHYVGVTIDKYWNNTTDYGYVDGILLYAMRSFDIGRNSGIFTEPGIYQIILNSALFFLLFDKECLDIEESKRITYITLIALTIITAKSTTGYIAFLVIVMFKLFMKSFELSERKMQSRLLKTITIAALVLVIDYFVRGESSIIQEVLFNKLFLDGRLSIEGSTGSSRWNLMLIALQSLIRHPLGVGYDSFNQLLLSQTGLTGAVWFSTLAGMGIQTMIVLMIWLFKPFIHHRCRGSFLFLFAAIYFNTVLAQSRLFYPALIIIPMLIEYSDCRHFECLENGIGRI